MKGGRKIPWIRRKRVCDNRKEESSRVSEINTLIMLCWQNKDEVQW